MNQNTEAKPRIKSKTHWAGSLLTVLGVVTQNAEALQPLFGQYGGVAMAVCGGLMMVLRELTSTPLKSITAK